MENLSSISDFIPINKYSIFKYMKKQVYGKVVKNAFYQNGSIQY